MLINRGSEHSALGSSFPKFVPLIRRRYVYREFRELPRGERERDVHGA